MSGRAPARVVPLGLALAGLLGAVMAAPVGAAQVGAAVGAAQVGAAPPGAASAGAGAAGVGVRTLATASSALTATDLQRVRATGVLFGHQSVGWNIVEGIGAVYAARGVTAPRMVVGPAPVSRAGFFAHDGIGSNGDPASKIRAFAALLRGGAAGRVGVAFMKLCYVDVTAGTDVSKVVAQYSRTVASLRASYPRLVILHLTVPLTTGSPADNAARGRYNALLRRAYGASGRLVDIATTEATAPSGARVSVAYRGTRYQAMFAGYTSDGGHLNAAGSRRVASALLLRIARAPR